MPLESYHVEVLIYGPEGLIERIISPVTTAETAANMVAICKPVVANVAAETESSGQ